MLSAGVRGPPVDLTKGLEIVDVVDRVVRRRHRQRPEQARPLVTFKLKNVSDQPLVALQVNAVFRGSTTRGMGQRSGS